MGTRPLNQEEIADIQEELEKARHRLALAIQYVQALEKKLANGTSWTFDMTQEEMKSIEKDCKAFSSWLDSGCEGKMPELHKYKWSWQKEKEES